MPRGFLDGTIVGTRTILLFSCALLVPYAAKQSTILLVYFSYSTAIDSMVKFTSENRDLQKTSAIDWSHAARDDARFDRIQYKFQAQTLAAT